MQAGKLRHLVTLQAKNVVGRDAHGGEVLGNPPWLDVINVFAEIDPWQLRERLVLRRQQGEAVIGLRVRAPLDVSLGKRFLHEGAGYGVIDIDATLKHKGALLITARAEDSAP